MLKEEGAGNKGRAKEAEGNPSSPATASLCRRENAAPQQMGTLAFYRYEQPIVDYCQAHQPLHMNRGFEPPSQALEGLGARERCAVPSAGLLPSVPAAPLSDIRTLPQ
ncbi:hypothetical protein G5714_009574 [Onychostoma macrolepis]|uniref:Uncharacterized protein n=1 Tax=Onychostoma macrolepis TaxID=369639 RepID=A0A7J6CXE9_9TELE|nr:hypothetical protein G5714_009574 [Onychostoma macrolepis]